MDIETALDAVRSLPPRAETAREHGRLRRDELAGSLAVGRNPLHPGELARLLASGVAAGAHPLTAYLDARDLAAAYAWIVDQRSLRAEDTRPLLAVDEIRRLHALAAAGRPELRPAAWRLDVPARSGGIVSPPPWSVPAETAALVERVRRRPARGTLPAWLAAFLVRFARIAPFAGANGRTARAATALLLRRLDLPPLALSPRRAADYRAALAAGLAGDRSALERLVALTLETAAARLVAAGTGEPLLPLRDLAGSRYPALIKAARRGRLRSVERDGRVLSTAAWVERYLRGEAQF